MAIAVQGNPVCNVGQPSNREENRRESLEAVAPAGEEVRRQRGNLKEKTGKEKKIIALNSVPMKTENKCN